MSGWAQRVVIGGLVVGWLAAAHARPAAAADEPVGRGWWGKVWRGVVWYLPNRLLDVTDLVSLRLGLTWGAHANVHLTRAVQAGLGGGPSIVLMKDYNRQVGTAVVTEWDFSALMIANGAVYTRRTTGTVMAGEARYWAWSTPSDEIYIQGRRDYWAVGLDLLFVGADVHPRELVDVALGFLGLDLRHDDW